ncbi:Coat Protein [Arhar cryptic virus-I]|uniref:Coat Protein n=1 Tax=Arhar cryptic virus-I TaxID=1585924 RepID=UPI000442CF20|nr:Coat Protein [Arhar cryptic virus-I]CDO45228.1 Coat Protein [Arhar cryptic virus-I]
MVDKRKNTDSQFASPTTAKTPKIVTPGEPSNNNPALSIVTHRGASQAESIRPEAELYPVQTKRLVLEGNPSYYRKLLDRKEIGYRRTGAGKVLTFRSFDLNVSYFRTAITDVMSRVLKIRYQSNGSMRQTEIDTEIATFVPHIVNVCMSALYAKLRSLNKSYGRHGTRYATAPVYTKDIEIPLPLALAIQELGSFQTQNLENNVIMIPTYPEGVQHEGRTAAEFPVAEYLSYVPTLLDLKIPLKSVDARIKTGSAWWTYKLEVIHYTADFICTIPRSLYSDMTALLRTLFLSGSLEQPPEDLVVFPEDQATFGTLLNCLSAGFNARTFLALIGGPKEEWSFGTN